jgi:hypothetical protein
MAEGNLVIGQIEAFLEDWPDEQQAMGNWFRLFYQELSTMCGVTLSFSARPGVSYSLRPRINNGNGREFFAIVDVIDDEPERRWLSVCFYMDMISDPEERGECIPGGLAGNDGYCFDLTGDDSNLARYLVSRLHEARAAAAA